MLFVPFGTLDNSPVDLPGYITDTGKPNLVRYAIAVYILVKVGAESNHIFLTKDFQESINLVDHKSYALLV